MRATQEVLEIPTACRIVSGVRTATVYDPWGQRTLAALVGAGVLGSFILWGIIVGMLVLHLSCQSHPPSWPFSLMLFSNGWKGKLT
nr:hypothetical protein [Streptococcus infantis]